MAAVSKVVKPDHVAVELCTKRAQTLRSQGVEGGERNFAQAMSQALGQGFGPVGAGFAGLNALARQFGLVPGVDFMAALDAADKVGASVALIDRNVDATLRGLQAALPAVSLAQIMAAPPPPLFDELNLAGKLAGAATATEIAANLATIVEEIKDRSHVEALTTWMNTAVPSVTDVMLHQRDKHMVAKLKSQCTKGRVVVVVGMAHVQGMQQEWDR